MLKALVLSCAIALGSCIVVTGEDNCVEDDVRCDGELVVQCVSDDWVIVDDCFSACAGTCGYDAAGAAVCFCP